MIDNEIIKALECCGDADCDNCPYSGDDLLRPCNDNLVKDTIDLINRQQAEIERLAKGCGIITEEDENWYPSPLKTPGEIKAEAVKEFAERFESKLNCIPQHHFTLAQVLYDLDKTKKRNGG